MSEKLLTGTEIYGCIAKHCRVSDLVRKERRRENEQTLQEQTEVGKRSQRERLRRGEVRGQ